MKGKSYGEKDNILDAYKMNQEKTIIDTSKKLKVGIIGTGWIATAHMNSFLNMPDVEIVAGADIVTDRAKEF